MNVAIDTNLENKQQNLAVLIATIGKALNVFQDHEDENILPLIQSKDRRTFLKKHTPDYKIRLQKLLQKTVWALPFWSLPIENWMITEMMTLLEALSNDLGQERNEQ